MSWQPVVFKSTAIFGAALAEAEAKVDGGDAQGVLNALLDTPRIDPHDATRQYPVPLCGHAGLYHYLTEQYTTLVVHPWTQGIGQGNGIYRALAPANAVIAAANKLLDVNDIIKLSGRFDLLGFIFSDVSYAALAQQLRQFLMMFSHPELLMCALRCDALARLEQTKTLLPDPAMNMHWQIAPTMKSDSFTHDVQALGEALAFAAGVDCMSESAEDEIAQVAVKKADLAEPLVIAAKQRINAIGGTGGQKLFIKDQTPAQLKINLLNSGAGYDQPYSICFLLVGAVDSLNNVAEFF